MQNRLNSMANALELHIFCIKPSIYICKYCASRRVIPHLKIYDTRLAVLCCGYVQPGPPFGKFFRQNSISTEISFPPHFDSVKVFAINAVYDTIDLLFWHVQHCVAIYWIGTGTHFTNDFSITIQMWWKFHFALIQILIKWSLQYLAHGTTAGLSWHVPHVVAIWSSAVELELNEISITFELWWKNR